MARSPFGSPEEKRRPPEVTSPPVETKPLETAEEDKEGSFEECRAERKAVEQPEQQKLEQAQEEFDECAEREKEIGDKVGAENPEDFDEEEYEECGGHYVAHVEYRVTDPEQGEISQAEANAAYEACEDPEDMQGLTDNLEARGGVEVESAEVIERPDPAVELHGTEAEKQEFIEAHREADEAAEKLEEAEEEAAEAREADEEPEEAAEGLEELQETPEEREEAGEKTEEAEDNSAEGAAEVTSEQAEEPEEVQEAADKDVEQPEEGEKTAEGDAEQTEGSAEEETEEAAEESEAGSEEDPEEAVESSPEKASEEVEEESKEAETTSEEDAEQAEEPEETEEVQEDADKDVEQPEEGEKTTEGDAEQTEASAEEETEEAAEESEAGSEEDPEEAVESSPEKASEEVEEESKEAETTSEEDAEQAEEPEEVQEAADKDVEQPEEGENTAEGDAEQTEGSAEEETEEAAEESEAGLEEDPEEAAESAPGKEFEEKNEVDPEEEELSQKETDDQDPEAVAQARERGEVPLSPEQAEAERVDIEKNAGKDGELRPDSDTFRRLAIEQHACEEQVEQTRQQLEQARQRAADSFANMPPFGSPEYKDALKAYNEARDRQQQLEEKLAESEEQLEELESTRRALYQQAFDGKQQRMNEIDQLQIRASEQQDRAETQIYAEHPSKEEMSRIVDSNTELIRHLSDAEAGLDAMIAARQAELNRYAAQKELDRWESEHDDHYLQMVREQQEWIQKKSELSYLRAKAEEDNRQLEELQQQTRRGFFGSIVDKLRGRPGGVETKNAESPPETAEGGEDTEYAELRRLGVEKIDLDECREEYRPQVIEAVRSMLERNPELVGQVKEIRCWKMPNSGTFASYGPSGMDEPFGGVLNLNASRFSSSELPQELETAGKNGWFVPESDVRSIVTHEMGHAVHLELCAANNGIEHGQIPDPDAYRRMVWEYKNNRHADTIVEAACKSYGIEFDSEAFADNLSAYGGENYGEAVAEAEAEAQNSPYPRPMALRIHNALQIYKQGLLERAARRKAEKQAPAGPEQPVTSQTAKQASAPENDFIRRLRKDVPTPEQQAEAVRRWQQRRKMETAADDGSDVMHGDGGARTRDTERDAKR